MWEPGDKADLCILERELQGGHQHLSTRRGKTKKARYQLSVSS